MCSPIFNPWWPQDQSSITAWKPRQLICDFMELQNIETSSNADVKKSEEPYFARWSYFATYFKFPANLFIFQRNKYFFMQKKLKL